MMGIGAVYLVEKYWQAEFLCDWTEPTYMQTHRYILLYEDQMSLIIFIIL
jgi:hypothetical protein